MTEIVADGIDNNCNGEEVCYRDNDGDLYGTSTTIVSTDLDCTDVLESSDSTDCNDTDVLENPGQMRYKDTD